MFLPSLSMCDMVQVTISFPCILPQDFSSVSSIFMWPNPRWLSLLYCRLVLLVHILFEDYCHKVEVVLQLSRVERLPDISGYYLCFLSQCLLLIFLKSRLTFKSSLGIFFYAFIETYPIFSDNSYSLSGFLKKLLILTSKVFATICASSPN